MSIIRWLTLYDNTHLLAAQVAVSLALFKLVGISFNALVYTSSILLAFSSILMTMIVWPDLSGRTSRSLALFLPLVTMFHPVEANALLWPFEIGWFMITFMLFANVFLVERFGRRALPWVAVICTVAGFSSAHGVFLWLAAILQIWLQRKFRRRWVWSMILFAGFGLCVTAIMTLTPADGGGVRQADAMNFGDAWSIIAYAVGLTGSVFGMAAPRMLWIFGLAGVALVLVWCWIIWHRDEVRSGERAGLVLIAVSVMFIGSFSLGRFRFGLPWALSDNHAGPMLVPLLCGLCLLAIEGIDSGRKNGTLQKLVAFGSCVFCVGSFVAFAPQAIQIGRESMVRRALAMHETCASDSPAPTLLVRRLNGLESHADLLEETLPIVRRLCTTMEPKAARMLEVEPRLFLTLAAAHPAEAQALSDLWDVYRSHFDLVRNIPIKSPLFAERLLNFAHDNAVTGSRYDPAMLAPYEAIFRQKGLAE
jgi:hypothetical protein